jgi:hypothetical protein
MKYQNKALFRGRRKRNIRSKLSVSSKLTLLIWKLRDKRILLVFNHQLITAPFEVCLINVTVFFVHFSVNSQVHAEVYHLAMACNRCNFFLKVEIGKLSTFWSQNLGQKVDVFQYAWQMSGLWEWQYLYLQVSLFTSIYK